MIRDQLSKFVVIFQRKSVLGNILHLHLSISFVYIFLLVNLQRVECWWTCKWIFLFTNIKVIDFRLTSTGHRCNFCFLVQLSVHLCSVFLAITSLITLFRWVIMNLPTQQIFSWRFLASTSAQSVPSRRSRRFSRRVLVSTQRCRRTSSWMRKSSASSSGSETRYSIFRSAVGPGKYEHKECSKGYDSTLGYDIWLDEECNKRTVRVVPLWGTLRLRGKSWALHQTYDLVIFLY